MNKNYISKNKEKVMINALEMECHRVFLNEFDLVYFYTYLNKTKLLWGTFCVFMIDHLFVDASDLDSFWDMMKQLGIIVYTEEQLEKLNKAK